MPKQKVEFPCSAKMKACVAHVSAKGNVDNPWAVCRASLGMAENGSQDHEERDIEDTVWKKKVDELCEKTFIQGKQMAEEGHWITTESGAHILIGGPSRGGERGYKVGNRVRLKGKNIKGKVVKISKSGNPIVRYRARDPETGWEGEVEREIHHSKLQKFVGMSAIEIDAFKSGNYPQGKFEEKELEEISSTYNPEKYEAPIVIGHLSDPAYEGKTTVPAFGWIGAVKKIGTHLKLVVSQLSSQLKEFVKKGLYKKVSVAFFQPDDPNNPTPGKWHLHHLAFLGAVPPAVKGLEQLAFAEIKGIGIEFAETDAEITEDGEPLDQDAIEEVEEIGLEDTLADLSESCATFLSKIEEALSGDMDYGTQKSRCQLAMSELSGELNQAMDMHWVFQEKLENVEDHQDSEMSEKKNWLIEFAKKLSHKRKESDMDKEKEQEYQDKIAGLDAQVKEFQEKERKANEKKAEDEAKAAEEAKKVEIKTFCDEAIKDNRMTPAEREKDEPIMLNLSKVSPEALKSFQEKYATKRVPTGTQPDLDKPPDQPEKKDKLSLATKYVKEHQAEFKNLQESQAIARAVYLEAMGEIKFIN